MVITENADRHARRLRGHINGGPCRSGVAALMRSANPELTWLELKLIKVQPQRPLPTLPSRAP